MYGVNTYNAPIKIRESQLMAGMEKGKKREGKRTKTKYKRVILLASLSY